MCSDCFTRISKKEDAFLRYLREGEITVKCPFCNFNFLRDIGDTVEGIVVS